MQGLITAIFGAFYRVRLENQEQLLTKLRGRLRISDEEQKGYGRYLKPDNPLCVGDFVHLEKAKHPDDEIEAVITKVLPRKNLFCRASSRRFQMLGANLDGVVAIQSLDHPAFNEGLLYRILTEAELAKIEPLIVFNKTDLRKKKTDYENIIVKGKYLSSLGYQIYHESFLNGISVKLQNRLKEGRFLVFGESGVGKSTFVNLIAPHSDQVTQELGASLRGRHTTVNPVLFQTKTNAQIIDVPGVREFGLMHRERPQIALGFREFLGVECRFDNCLHMHEPGCGVKEKLEAGNILPSRYEHYIKMVETIQEHHKPRRGDFRKR